MQDRGEIQGKRTLSMLRDILFVEENETPDPSKPVPVTPENMKLEEMRRHSQFRINRILAEMCGFHLGKTGTLYQLVPPEDFRRSFPGRVPAPDPTEEGAWQNAPDFLNNPMYKDWMYTCIAVSNLAA